MKRITGFHSKLLSRVFASKIILSFFFFSNQNGILKKLGDPRFPEREKLKAFESSVSFLFRFSRRFNEWNFSKKGFYWFNVLQKKSKACKDLHVFLKREYEFATNIRFFEFFFHLFHLNYVKTNKFKNNRNLLFIV